MHGYSSKHVGTTSSGSHVPSASPRRTGSATSARGSGDAWVVYAQAQLESLHLLRDAYARLTRQLDDSHAEAALLRRALEDSRALAVMEREVHEEKERAAEERHRDLQREAAERVEALQRDSATRMAAMQQQLHAAEATIVDLRGQLDTMRGALEAQRADHEHELRRHEEGYATALRRQQDAAVHELEQWKGAFEAMRAQMDMLLAEQEAATVVAVHGYGPAEHSTL